MSGRFGSHSELFEAPELRGEPECQSVDILATVVELLQERVETLVDLRDVAVRGDPRHPFEVRTCGVSEQRPVADGQTQPAVELVRSLRGEPVHLEAKIGHKSGVSAQRGGIKSAHKEPPANSSSFLISRPLSSPRAIDSQSAQRGSERPSQRMLSGCHPSREHLSRYPRDGTLYVDTLAQYGRYRSCTRSCL